ncbi:uncharacterized protein (DUF58 family) [Sinobaca qinghaiensis]|uniref:Uncharacterized protein (DUF58 family) n=1 Tax=Sinobaca qinghaiensis TaxID=342944 RepID=A0A419V003_9BACL|nr:DUF58 domain-containing protein [Sinobaca qinghaiensis]RKD71274.1 uncharacterized protein (DUF58 family) [Sinobaca qinghaiensis]
MTNAWYGVIKYAKLLFVLVLAGALYAYAMFQGGFVSWFLFYSILTVILFNLLFVLFPLRWIDIERTCSKNILAHGEQITVRLTMTKRFAFPLVFISIWDHVPYGLEGTGRPSGTIYFFSMAKTVTYEYDVKGVRRGEYRFKQIHLQAGDLFGFFTKDYESPVKSTLLVLPKIQPLFGWQPSSDEQSDDVAISRRTSEEAYSIAGARDYVPGDRMTSIDWKATARGGKLVTKEFESQKGEGYLLIVENLMQQKDEETFEAVIECAAALADENRSRGISLGLAFSSEQNAVMEEAGGISHFKAMYERLAVARIESNKKGAAPFFKKVPASNSLLFVTSSLSSERIEELQSYLWYGREVTICLVETNMSDTGGNRDMLLNLRKQGMRIFTARTQADGIKLI